MKKIYHLILGLSLVLAFCGTAAAAEDTGNLSVDSLSLQSTVDADQASITADSSSNVEVIASIPSWGREVYAWGEVETVGTYSVNIQAGDRVLISGGLPGSANENFWADDALRVRDTTTGNDFYRDCNGAGVEIAGGNIYWQSPVEITNIFQTGDNNLVITVEDKYGYGIGSSNLVMYKITSGNQPPTANAGPDQTVNVNTPVNLQGSGSDPEDGPNVNYSWSYTDPNGNIVQLGTTSTVTFTPTIAGEYIATLTVTDSQQETAQDQLMIKSTPDISGKWIGTSHTIGADESYALTMDVTQYPDNTVSGSLKYLITQSAYYPQDIGKIAVYDISGSVNGNIFNINGGPNSALTDPSILWRCGYYSMPMSISSDGNTISYTGYDGTVESVTYYMTRQQTNQPPTANAGEDKSDIPVNTPVTLQGSGSDPEDGTNVNYSWSYTDPNGNIVQLGTTPKVTFTPTIVGDYIATLTVTDSQQASDDDEVTISVTASGIDLKIGSITSPERGFAGDTIKTTVTVFNAGSESVANFLIGLYLSNDLTIGSADDIQIGLEGIISSLDPGKGLPVEITIKIPTKISSANYYLGAFVDNLYLIPETDEKNNVVANSFPVGNKYALVVGINDYPEADIRDTVGANSAKAMVNALKKLNFNVKPLLDEDATDRAIGFNLFNYQSKLKPQDIFLFYFAGHGTDDGSLSLQYNMQVMQEQLELPNKKKEKHSTSFYYSDLIDAINWNEAWKNMIILDCCYSGDVLKQQNIDTQRTIIMTASPGNERAYAEENKLTLLSKYLIQGLSAKGNEKYIADSNSNGIITTDELWSYAIQQDYAGYQNNNPVIQHPQYNDYNQDIPLLYYQ